MKERLQKILSARGVASRRKAEELIQEGQVTVNGEKAALGDTADPDRDKILISGQPLPPKQEFVYLLLNKPRGFVTTMSDEKGRPTAVQLVADCGTRVYPVGRLDMDSEGLLLFTNDGEFANRMIHPRQELDKVYEVWVNRYTPGAQRELAKPVVLDGYKIRPPKVELLSTQGSTARFRVTIHEGRNRQIRRMCEALGLEVARLRRTSIGPLKLGMLKPGTYRDLTAEELRAIRNAIGGDL